ncbi:multidrug resistance protein, MATE family [Trypanosoma conorhini]|uniref:Multidrug resistance protein, MATE family n=1 Tax=Trypanosoma conorhini TaxID=83891 RepID=A0A3R7K9I5_9TRYP|nr:multidrug resistance protein, MATE family [Trypanosoma conorhini]RNF02155.1 multidrug resistance protein, MATE family [Trypanosoma conorhini]
MGAICEGSSDKWEMASEERHDRVAHAAVSNALIKATGSQREDASFPEPPLPVDDNISTADEICVSELQLDDDVLSWCRIVLGLIPLDLPSAMSIALTFGLAVVSLAFIGAFLGHNSLSGASVGHFIGSIFAQYQLCELTFAMDALCSQAYGRDPCSDEPVLSFKKALLLVFYS